MAGLIIGLHCTSMSPGGIPLKTASLPLEWGVLSFQLAMFCVIKDCVFSFYVKLLLDMRQRPQINVNIHAYIVKECRGSNI